MNNAAYSSLFLKIRAVALCASPPSLHGGLQEEVKSDPFQWFSSFHRFYELSLGHSSLPGYISAVGCI